MPKKQTGGGLPDLGFLNEYVYGYDIHAPEANDPAKQSEFKAGVADWMARGRLKGDDKKDDFSGKRKATNLEKLTGGLLGVDTDDVLQRAGQLVTQKEAKDIRELPANKNIDFSRLSAEDLRNPIKVQDYINKVGVIESERKKGGVITLDPTKAGIGEIIQQGTQSIAEASDEIKRNSLDWITQRGDAERRFNIDKTALLHDAEQAAALLEATKAQALAQIQQQELDRDYMDRRDLREYNYRIKKDDQEQLDKIFALILGGVDRMF